jgi:hypothetical protein
MYPKNSFELNEMIPTRTTLWKTKQGFVVIHCIIEEKGDKKFKTPHMQEDNMSCCSVWLCLYS